MQYAYIGLLQEKSLQILDPLTKQEPQRIIANMRPKDKEKTLLTVDGYALTQLRIKAGMPMSVLVKHFPGCNKSTISRWEQGIWNPSEERLWKLVEIFGTTEFIRLNGKVVVTGEEVEELSKMFPNRDLFRLNNKVILTAEEIEAVKKLREG